MWDIFCQKNYENRVLAKKREKITNNTIFQMRFFRLMTLAGILLKIIQTYFRCFEYTCSIYADIRNNLYFFSGKYLQTMRRHKHFFHFSNFHYQIIIEIQTFWPLFFFYCSVFLFVRDFFCTKWKYFFSGKGEDYR